MTRTEKMSASDFTSRKAALQVQWANLCHLHPELKNWTLDVNTRFTSNFGKCYWIKRQIAVAAWVVDADLDQAVDTLRHEAAHALAGEGAAHGPKWKEWALRLNAQPKRCGPKHVSAKSPAALRRKPTHALYCRWCNEMARVFYRKPSRSYDQSCWKHTTCGSGLQLVELRSLGDGHFTLADNSLWPR